MLAVLGQDRWPIPAPSQLEFAGIFAPLPWGPFGMGLVWPARADRGTGNTVRKPINRFALALWIAAVVFVIADVPMAIAIRQMAMEIQYAEGPQMIRYVTLANVWAETRSALLGGGQLAALGMLIELLDQIRWNGLLRNQPAREPNSN